MQDRVNQEPAWYSVVLMIDGYEAAGQGVGSWLVNREWLTGDSSAAHGRFHAKAT